MAGGAWRYTDAITSDPFVVVRIGGDAPFERLWVGVPRLVRDPAAGDDAEMIWDPTDVRRSPPLNDVVWEFIRLAQGTPEAIADFAERFGPLGIPGGGDVNQTAGAGTIREPVPAWRSLAQDLAALLGFAVDLPHGELRDDRWPETLVSFDPPVETERDGDDRRPAAVADPDRDARQAAVMALDAALRSPEVRRDLVGRGVSALLGASGVRPAFVLDPDGNAGPALAVPTVRNVGGDGPDDGFREARALLPVLACQVARAFVVKVFRCSWCGLPCLPKPGTKAPRRDQPWYGKHDHCRREARLHTKSVSAKKAYAKRTAAPPDS